MYIQSDKCEANQMDSTNAAVSANASARLSEEVCADTRTSATVTNASAETQVAVPAAPVTNAPAETQVAIPAATVTNAPAETQVAIPAATVTNAPAETQVAVPAAPEKNLFIAPPAPHHAHHFFGIDIGVLKIGFKDHAFAFGLDAAVVKVNAQIGRESHVDAGVDFVVIGARAGAGLGANHHGFHSDAGGRFHLAKLVDTGTELKAKLGPRSSLHADVGAKVLSVHTRHTFDSNANEEGFNNGYKGDVGLGKVAMVQATGHADLNDDSSLGAQVKTNLQDDSLAAGADIGSQSNTLLQPDVHVEASSGVERARLDAGAQIGPTLDLRAGTAYDTTAMDSSQHSGQLSAGIGQSGVGVQAIDIRDGRSTVAKAGWGPDYMADF